MPVHPTTTTSLLCASMIRPYWLIPQLSLVHHHRLALLLPSGQGHYHAALAYQCPLQLSYDKDRVGFGIHLLLIFGCSRKILSLQLYHGIFLYALSAQVDILNTNL